MLFGGSTLSALPCTPVTVSIGIAESGKDPSPDSLYKRADRALYRSKNDVVRAMLGQRSGRIIKTEVLSGPDLKEVKFAPAGKVVAEK